jgi:hypothetical protein
MELSNNYKAVLRAYRKGSLWYILNNKYKTVNNGRRSGNQLGLQTLVSGVRFIGRLQGVTMKFTSWNEYAIASILYRNGWPVKKKVYIGPPKLSETLPTELIKWPKRKRLRREKK